MHTLTRTVRQPAVLAVLGLTALYIALILLLESTFEGGCQESYPMNCRILELDLPGLLLTVLLLAAVAVAAGVCATRPRSGVRGMLLVAVVIAGIVVVVVGFHLSLNPALETRY
ncbi:hypothetical protein ITJ57_17160 [Plantibacter sp. VKM Ac-2880]|uniref:hypothetical protein n=1 Tax=Plantibacter sp. VKM Ac-2880 TaxID=2783827 RepID=UPI00188F4EA8|nr:hypothetical protein [Plantibacter sp. VKM Ac-2880]MBF4570498.1 hypothetical protein [Plantibacter sp. VKM Ac-2880]